MFIYASSTLLKRRILKVYTMRTGEEYVYGWDSEKIFLTELDYLRLPKFSGDITHWGNSQHNKGWKWKRRNRELSLKSSC